MACMTDLRAESLSSALAEESARISIPAAACAAAGSSSRAASMDSWILSRMPCRLAAAALESSPPARRDFIRESNWGPPSATTLFRSSIGMFTSRAAFSIALYESFAALTSSAYSRHCELKVDCCHHFKSGAVSTVKKPSYSSAIFRMPTVWASTILVAFSSWLVFKAPLVPARLAFSSDWALAASFVASA